MKRLISIFSAAVISIAAGVYSAFAADTAVDTSFIKAETILDGAGLIVKNEFEAEHIMTRGEFAYLISRSAASGSPASETDRTEFFDVPGVYKYADAIRIASTLGIMSGYDNGTFEPHREISVDEAVAALVKLSGYGIWAENNGGYPNGYYSAAGEIGLLKNADGGIGVTYSRAVIMLKNTLEADYVEISFSGGNPVYNKRKDSILSEIADVYDDKGIVKANRLTSLSSANGTGSGDILIDTGTEIIRAKDENIPADDYLGYEVEFYYKLDEYKEAELIYIAPTDKNRILEVSYDEIEDDTTTKTLKYSVGSRTKKEDLKADIITIYNGKYFSGETDSTYHPLYGGLKLLDNDNDGKYDIIFVSDLEAMEVTGVDRELVYYNNGRKKYDYDNYSDVAVIKNGKTVSLAAIANGDIITAAHSKSNGLARLEVSDKKISGEVSVISDDKITVNGEEYKLNPYFSEDVSPGKSYTFKLDVYGTVVCTDSGNTVDNTYMIMISLRTDINSADPMTLTAYTTLGEMSEFSCTDKLKIDGIAYYADGGKEAAMAHLKLAAQTCGLGLGSYTQPVRVKFNTNGIISQIDTVMISRGGSLYKDTKGDADNSLIQSSASGSMRYYKSGVFQGKFVIDPATLIYSIPTDRDDFSSYSVMKQSDFKEQNYNVTAYNLDDCMRSELIIVSSQNDSYEENFGMVSKINGIYDEQYDTGIQVDVMVNGAVVGLKLFGENKLPQGLEKGDLIRYSLNYNGTCGKITRVFDKSEDIGFYSTKLPTTTGSGSYTSETRIAYGKAVNQEKGLFTLTYGAENDKEVYVPGDSPVMIYDSGRDAVERGTINDIIGSEQSGVDCDVVVYTRYAVVKAIAVYK